MLMPQETKKILPLQMYRTFLMRTIVWPGVRARDNSLVIKVHEHKDSTKPPLIWFGSIAEIQEIIASFGKDRSIYGIQTTFTVVDTTEKNIAALAQYYAAEIQSILPSGPYVLSGNCIATFLLLEVANGMINQGCEIGFIGIVERDVTEKKLELRLIRLLFRFFDILGNTGHEIKIAFRQDTLGKFFSQLKYCLFYFLRETCKILQLQKTVVYINNKLKGFPNKITSEESDCHNKSYQLKPYPDKIHLFFIRWGVFGFHQFKYFQKYWKKIALGGMTVDLIFGISHSHPNWRDVLKRLSDRIEDAGF